MKTRPTLLRVWSTAAILALCQTAFGTAAPDWRWLKLPPFPEPPGVAGAFGGMDNGALIVAGGSNFLPAAGEDLWAAPKVWHRKCFVLVQPGSDRPRWIAAGRLAEAKGNGASASSPCGLVCLGGENRAGALRQAFVLRWEGGKLKQRSLPDLPVPGACGAAAAIGRTVYFLTGQTGSSLGTADPRFWSLDLPAGPRSATQTKWTELAPLPGRGRAFAALVAQSNGKEVCLYAIGGRRSGSASRGTAAIEPLRDVYQYLPSENRWRRRSNAPTAIMAAPVVPLGASRILVLGGDDGRLASRVADLKSSHPGFAHRAYVYDTISDEWSGALPIPANQVASVAGSDAKNIFLAAGEIKPRHRTTAVWRITTNVARPRD